MKTKTIDEITQDIKFIITKPKLKEPGVAKTDVENYFKNHLKIEDMESEEALTILRQVGYTTAGGALISYAGLAK